LIGILSKSNNFLGIGSKHSSYPHSQIVIVSAPLEKTVSYGKGTAAAPKAILKASHYVEFYDEETKRELCFEKGICTLASLNFNKIRVDESLNKTYKLVKEILEDNKFVVTLGGEHTVSYAPVKVHLEKYPRLSVLQIDAHSDLRDTYEGTKYSHACVMARVAEHTKNIVQVGIRAQAAEEAEFIKKNKINTFYARDIRQNKLGRDWKKKVLSKLNKNVYITFDVDGLDPSVIPATGTPEPGGLMWDETMDLLKLVGKERNIVGFDVVELAPNKHHTASDFITAKLVYKILNYAFIKK